MFETVMDIHNYIYVTYYIPKSPSISLPNEMIKIKAKCTGMVTVL